MDDNAKLEALLSSVPGLRQSLAMAHDLRAGLGNSEPAAAKHLISGAMLIAAAIVGDDAMQEALGPELPADAPREDHLRRLARRLALMDGFWPSSERLTPSSFDSVALEAEVVARGDSPRLFEQIKLGAIGRGRGNTYRRALTQMRALQWDAFFRSSTDLRPGEVQVMVGHAFGVAPSAYVQWKDPVRAELGGDYFDQLMELATGEWRGVMMAPDLDTAKALLERDGRAYIADQKRASFGPVP